MRRNLLDHVLSSIFVLVLVLVLVLVYLLVLSQRPVLVLPQHQTTFSSLVQLWKAFSVRRHLLDHVSVRVELNGATALVVVSSKEYVSLPLPFVLLLHGGIAASLGFAALRPMDRREPHEIPPSLEEVLE